MKSLSKILILCFIFNANIINCKVKHNKNKRNTYTSKSNISKADAIRPTDISKELFCDACHGIITEALKNLRNLKKESDVAFYLNNKEFCSYKNFNGYHFSNPEMEVACEVLIGEYYDEVEKLLMERIPNKDTKETLIDKFCYKTINACDGVDLSQIKPINTEVIDGKLFDVETEEKVISAIPHIEDVDIGDDDDFDFEKMTNRSENAEF